MAQPAEGASYASKIEKAEAAIDWSQPAQVIERRMRAFDPFPGAASTIHGETMKLWCAQVEAAVLHPAPGVVLEAGERGIVVACGTGALRLTELQRAGGKRLPAAALLRGFPIGVGEQFEAA